MKNLSQQQTSNKSFIKSFKNFFLGHKSKTNKILKIFLILFLYLISSILVVFGVLNIFKKNNDHGLFGLSQTVTYKLNPISQNKSNFKLVENEVKQTANNFSNWLIYKNILNNGVSYEVKLEDAVVNDSLSNTSSNILQKSYVGYIYVNYVNVPKFKDSISNKNVDVNPLIVGTKNINNSNIEIWEYNKPKNNSTIGVTDESNFYKLIFNNQNIDFNSARKDNRQATKNDKVLNNFGIVLDLKQNTNLKNANLFAEQKKLADNIASGTSYDTNINGNLEWLVFQNLDGLVNKLNNAKNIYINYYKNYLNPDNFSTGLATKSRIDYEAFKNENSSLSSWAEIASFEDTNKRTLNTQAITKKDVVKFYQKILDVDKSQGYGTSADVSLKSIVESNLIGKITRDNFIQWFPSNKTNIDFKNQKTISIQKSTSSLSEQKDLIYQLKNTTLPIDFWTQNKNDLIYSNKNDFEFFINGSGWLTKPFVKNSITKLSSYNSFLVASGIFLLLVAIIISILYRIPGIFGSLAIIFSFGFSAVSLFLLNVNLSIGTLASLYISLVLAIVSILLTMERTKKLVLQNHSIFDSIQSGIKKSMFTVLDINIISTILALSMFFLAKGELADYALSLVMTPLIVLGSVFVLFFFPLYIYSGFRSSWKINLLFTFLKKNTTYSIWFNEKKWWIIWTSLFSVIFIGIILYFTIGISDSTFKNGTIIHIKTDLGLANKLIESLNSNWHQITYNDSVLEARSNFVYDFNQVDKEIKAILNNNNSYVLNVSTNSSTIPSSIFLSGVYGILAGLGFVSIYYLFRLNIFLIIPTFLINCFSILTTITLLYIFQLPVSIFFVYVLVSCNFVSNIFISIFCSVTKTRFNKKDLFDIPLIKKFIKNNIQSILNVLNLMLIFNLFFGAIFSTLISFTTIYLFVSIALSSIIIMYLSSFIIAHMFYYSIVVREKYINNIIYNIDNKINSKFSEVDEQLIFSINKFR